MRFYFYGPSSQSNNSTYKFWKMRSFVGLRRAKRNNRRGVIILI